MMFNKKLPAAVLSAFFFASLLTGCAKGGTVDSGRLSIVCTNFSEYDWTREIIGDTDSAEVRYLLESGMDIHNYQPSTQDMMNISDCDMFVYVGGESESWVDDALRGARNKDMRVVKLFESVKNSIRQEEYKEGMEQEADSGEADYDEHVWLSLRNAEVICSDICGTLCEIDPDNGDSYRANLAAYTEKLEALDREYAEVAENASVRTLVVCDRFPFRYLVDDYGIDYYAAFSGCSAETEASFDTIMTLSRKIDELGLENVIIIENSDDAIARSVISSTKDKNAAVHTLDSMQSVTSADIKGGADYLSIMRDNLETLKKVLE